MRSEYNEDGAEANPRTERRLRSRRVAQKLSQLLKKRYISLGNAKKLSSLAVNGYFCSLKMLSLNKTLGQFDEIMHRCKALFLQKHGDYGASWRVMRLPSLTDQIMIKAYRIRSVEEKGSNVVGESVEGEFVGMINYCFMSLMAWKYGANEEGNVVDLSLLVQQYDEARSSCRDLLSKKNDDYSEIWREMRVSSMTDMIIMKLKRIKQIEDRSGLTEVSEGVDAGYRDIVNYSVFALILLGYLDS